MHAGALRALEFDRIVDVIRGFAQTPQGEAHLAALQPATEPRAVAAALAATSETVSFLAGNQIAVQAPHELQVILEGVTVEGRPLEPLQLLALATFLSTVNTTCSAVRRARASFPILLAIVERAASFDQEIADVQRKIDPAGDVVDDASPELRRIRESLRRQRTRLRGTLESYLRGKDTAKYLQQQIVTDRHGRYVLVVRAEHRGAIPGIVHGSSGSGASLYLEPLSTVEINNDIVELEQQEHEEVRRILLALTDAFRGRADDLERTVDAAARLDVLNARARFSILVRGIEPKIAKDGRLELRSARHPLLIPAIRRHVRNDLAESGASGETPPSGAAAADDREPVPVDILLVPPVNVLVVTGPNTGGKTVALKTAGLLPLLAQAGLLIPVAEESQIPVFRSVFADIGDEQSIANSLSTFSGHIANIVAMDGALQTPALVLLDEAGAGTDPMEGGALAMAIIEHFRLRSAKVIATTHYDALKTYASTTEGVTPAGFGFDPKTFAPTYRLNYGSPGSSLAFEIANRLGLPAVDHPACAGASQRARESARRSSGASRARDAVARSRPPARGTRAPDTGRRHRQAQGPRGGAEDSRGNPPPQARPEDRGAAARSPSRDRRGRRPAQGADRNHGDPGRARGGAADPDRRDRRRASRCPHRPGRDRGPAAQNGGVRARGRGGRRGAGRSGARRRCRRSGAGRIDGSRRDRHSRCRGAMRRSTFAASGCAHASAICASRRAPARPNPRPSASTSTCSRARGC